jgi:Leucine-rich repeat (LRR) protein
MRQIVDSENDKFLNGDINVIDYVLAKYLKIGITEIQNLKKLRIRINGSYGLLNQFGQRLINLQFLKLNDSFIQSIDDLGSNFSNLKILQINNCKLKDLSGIICFEQLEIFETKNNEISDLIELEMSTTIVKLNLENNLIENEQNIYFLSSMDN